MVGGAPVDPSLAGSIVRVGSCSGTLIAPSMVLTAAHCVEASGSVEVRAPSAPEKTTAKCIVHPGYRSSEATHDLAICRLDAPSSARPIPLARDAPEVGAAVKLVGYGLAAPFERGTGELRSVDTRVVRVSKEGLLAGTTTETACRGDSGGPMLAGDGATSGVAGVIHGPSGAFCASPAVVVRVADDRAWIESVIAPEPASRLPLGVGGLAVVVVLARVVVAARRRRAATRSPDTRVRAAADSPDRAGG